MRLVIILGLAAFANAYGAIDYYYPEANGKTAPQHAHGNMAGRQVIGYPDEFGGSGGSLGGFGDLIGGSSSGAGFQMIPGGMGNDVHGLNEYNIPGGMISDQSGGMIFNELYPDTPDIFASIYGDGGQGIISDIPGGSQNVAGDLSMSWQLEGNSGAGLLQYPGNFGIPGNVIGPFAIPNRPSPSQNRGDMKRPSIPIGSVPGMPWNVAAPGPPRRTEISPSQPRFPLASLKPGLPPDSSLGRPSSEKNLWTLERQPSRPMGQEPGPIIDRIPIRREKMPVAPNAPGNSPSPNNMYPWPPSMQPEAPPKSIESAPVKNPSTVPRVPQQLPRKLSLRCIGSLMYGDAMNLGRLKAYNLLAKIAQLGSGHDFVKRAFGEYASKDLALAYAEYVSKVAKLAKENKFFDPFGYCF